MKKILFLIAAIGSFVAVQAQSSRDEARRVILGQENKTNETNRNRDVIFGGNNGSDYSSRQAEIDRVNRDYDAKIYSIRNNNNLSQAEKDRIISRLEKDRQYRLKDVNKRYDRYGNSRRDERRDDDKNYDDRNGKGKKLGWEKGKGNPHKSEGREWKNKKSKKSKKDKRDRD